MKKLKFFLVVLLFFSTLTSALPARAIYGGTSALDSKLVLTIATTKDIRAPFCTAALLTDRIVVTAAHCVAKDQGEYPDLRFKTSEIYVTQPGVNTNSDNIATRVKVLKVVFKPGYKNLWKPEAKEESTQRDDIAFLFLQEPLISNYLIKIATLEEIEQFVKSGGDVIHYGYGLQKVNVQDGGPYTLKLKAMPGYPTKTDLNPQNRFNTSTVIFSKEDGRALCPGDSGGPWYGEIAGEIKILAVTVAASGCRSEPPYNGNTLGTLISPYLTFMEAEWKKFLTEEAAIKAEFYQETNRFEIAKQNGTLIVSAGCHGNGIKAELQINTNGQWNIVAPSYGMIPSDKSCPLTHPATPWTVADIPDKSVIRWRYWSPGAWDVTSDFFVYSKIASSPSPSPSPMPSSSVSSTSSPGSAVTDRPKSTPIATVLKRKTITCIKGKSIKRITAFKPTCPSGYKLKK
jgi:secreted trypsin-like serine protease